MTAAHGTNEQNLTDHSGRETMRIGRCATAVLAAVTLLLGSSACDTFGPGDKLGQFEWGEIDTGPVTETSDVEVIGQEILFIGEFNTPTSCFRLSPDYRESGSVGTLRVRALTENRSNCVQETASFRYQGLLRGITRINELRVRHEIEGLQATEFIHPVVP